MKCHKCLFFLAHVRYFPGKLNYQTSSFDLNIWEVARFSLGVTQPAICWRIMVYLLGFVFCSCFLRIIPYNLRLFFSHMPTNPLPVCASPGLLRGGCQPVKRRKERPRVFVTGRWRKRSAYTAVLKPYRSTILPQKLHVWFTYRNPKDSVWED